MKPHFVYQKLLFCCLLIGICVTNTGFAWSLSPYGPGNLVEQCAAGLLLAPAVHSTARCRVPVALLAAASTAAETAQSSKTLRVTGEGLPPAGVENAAIRREMAERAALSDAERKLVQAVAEIGLGADGTVRSRMGEGNFSRRIEGFIKGYRVAGERHRKDGGIEIDLELELTGKHELSHILLE